MMRVLAVTGGHSFDREAFAEFLDSLPGDIRWIEQPEAVDLISAGGLDLVDETYLCPVFEQDVTPLLLTDAPIDDTVHYSTVEGAAGRLGSRGDGWHHPPGSSLAAWTKPAGRGRLVYIQPGDTGRTLGD